MERIAEYEAVRKALAMLPNSIGISRYCAKLLSEKCSFDPLSWNFESPAKTSFEAKLTLLVQIFIPLPKMPF